MNSRIKKLLPVMFICIMSLSQPLWAFIGSGSGTYEDPYVVSTAAEFNDVRNDLTAYYQQSADISLSGYANWTKIGASTSSYFSGTFDGNGHKITGLSITSTSDSYNGLFGVIGSGGTVKNLGVTGANLSSSNPGLGILAGYNFGGTVENCYTTGTVTTSNNNPGGLLGTSSGTVTKCYSTATITATGATSSNVGGLIGAGLTNTGSISQCYCSGNVSNNNTTGSFNTGGFIGLAAHAISNCYATGNVSSSTGGRAGGFIGGTGTGTPAFTYCYSKGSVTCPTRGGFVGFVNTGSFTNCFFDYETAGTTDTYGTYQTTPPTGITAHTTTEMKTPSTYSGWSTSYWTLNDGSYPTLKCFDVSLPVELSSFTAGVEGNAIILNWQTESETDNLGFTLERAEGNNAWQQIASYKTNPALKGRGNSSTTTTYTFTDNSVATGTEYRYRLADVNTAGTVTMHSPISVTMTALPQSTEMLNAYPNPFNPETRITYQLHKVSQVTIAVYDIMGRQVKTLIDEQQAAGSYQALWNGTDESGAKIASGTYIVRMQTNNEIRVQKVLLLK